MPVIDVGAMKGDGDCGVGDDDDGRLNVGG